MMKSYTILLVLFTLIPSAFLRAQFDTQFFRDSIEIEKGVPGTEDFEHLFKVINEEADDMGRPLLSIIYQYVSPTELLPFHRQQFEYEDDDVAYFLLESWDAGQQEWMPVKEETSSYDDGQLMFFLRKKESGGELVNFRRWQYEYNAEGKETERQLQVWDLSGEMWENFSRKTINYDADGNLMGQLLERYINDNWENRIRRMWTWSADELQPSVTLTQKWSIADEEWVNDVRKTYGMASNNFWAGSVIEQWNEATGEWENLSREIFELDNPNNRRVWTFENWDDGWEPDVRSVYDFTGLTNAAVLQQWSDLNATYENNLRYRTIFDPNGLPLEKTGMQEWNAGDQEWLNQDFTRRYTYFWTEKTTSTISNAIQNRCFIPNPYQIGMPIACDIPLQKSPVYLEVTNLIGQTLIRESLDGSELRIQGVPPGLYVVKISDAARVYHLEKIVISN
jgi:hypothetical protein